MLLLLRLPLKRPAGKDLLKCNCKAMLISCYVHMFSICSEKALNKSIDPYSPDGGQNSVFLTSVWAGIYQHTSFLTVQESTTDCAFPMPCRHVYISTLTLRPLGNICHSMAIQWHTVTLESSAGGIL